MSRNLALRIAVAGVAIPGALVVLWLGGWPLAALLAVLGGLGAREVYDLARRQGIAPLSGLGYVAAGGIPALALATATDLGPWGEGGALLGALWLMVLLAAASRLRGPQGRPLNAVAVTILGTLYASGFLAFLIAIRHGDVALLGRWPATCLAAFPLAVTWICDTAAMAAGKAIGGPKIAPVLSPNKTWAGAIAATAGAVAAAMALGAWVLAPAGVALGPARAAGAGLALGVVAQVGDVAESLFKREAGVKDSSSLIPGHGGVLDRLDSLYFAIPTAAGLFHLYGLI